MHWKNWLLKKILPPLPDIPIPQHLEKILIVSTTALGDTLWAVPALRALKKEFPPLHITFLTSPLGKEALLHCPYIDDIVAVKNPLLGSLAYLLWKWRKKKFDATIVFHASQRAIFPFLTWIHSGYRISHPGFNKGLDFLFHQLIEDTGRHEIERRLELVHCLGAKPDDASLELHYNQEDRSLVEQFIQDHGIDPLYPIICLHPGASKPFKQWPAEYFAQAGKMLQEHLGAHIIVTGSSSEEDLVELVAGKIPKSIKAIGDLPVRSLGYLYKQAQMVITNDTGPLHVAISAGAKAIALFSATHPKRCGPYLNADVTIIHKRKACTPCLQKQCANPFCMRQISVNEVFQAALSLYYSHK